MTKKLFFLIVLICAICHGNEGQVTADFSASITRSCVSTQVEFYDQSTSSSGDIVAWEWDLNGISANKENPSTIFTAPGGYDICLIAIDATGQRDTLCREDYVIIWEKPVASFARDMDTGCSIHEVTFTNTSTSANGDIVESIWDVGGSTNLVIVDDIDSMITSTYVTPATYGASLFVKDDKGCTASVNVSDAVTVLPLPTIDYTFEVLSGCELPWEVQFTNQNPDAGTMYNWDFGNGETFNGPNPPLITYDTALVFDITIAIEKNGCVDTIRDQGLISPGAAPDFTVDPIGACVNTALTFAETSQISSDSIFWDFGDGTFSTISNPMHTYTSAGCFDVSMIRYSGECIDTVRKPCVMINPAPTISAVVDNQFACDLPVEIGFVGEASEPGSFIWTFEGLGADKTLFDDTTSLLVNQNGSYTIDLDYISDAGCTASIEDLPVVIETFEASLPTSSNVGCIPLSVSLEENIASNLDIASWEWTVFKDGGLLGDADLIFNSENPIYTENDTGRYDVQLIVESETGCLDTILAEEYIKAGIAPEVDFTAEPLEDCILAPKNFTAITSEYADAWVWGTDGTDTLSIEQNPSIYLTSAKAWDISLTAYHNGCGNTIIKENYINILEPGVSYVVEYDCDDPYTVTLDDRTTGADSSYWEIELGPDNRDTFFNTNLQQYTFPERGRYFINHYAINYETGCEHYRIDTIVITDPQAIMTLDTLQGCAPLTINVIGDSQDALQLDYVIPGATIDSSLSVLDPVLTYTESGPFTGPQLIITDYHGCQDTVTIMDSVLVNAPTAMAGYPAGVCVPDSAQLIDLSTDRLGEIVERRWYFDNASVYSEEESLYVQIIENKFYTLSLAVTDDWGCTDSIYIAQSIYGSDLDSSFYTVDTLTCTDSSVRFLLNNTQQGVVDYLWDFGDGTTSTLAAPHHTYDEEGQYTVCVTINDIYNCPKTSCRENYITVLDPIASFTGDPLYETCPPLITNFSNASNNTSMYIWDFGDNTGLSESENPAHIYNEPGTFDVTLIASSTPRCADTLTLIDYVTIDGPSGSFEFKSDSSCLPLTLDLVATADDFYTFGWDFGNGETSISQTQTMTDTVQYIYEETGSFIPQLILSDGNGCIRSFVSDTVFVNSLELDFLSNIELSCEIPTNVEIQNLSQSTDQNIQYNWEILGNENLNFNSLNSAFSLNEIGPYTVILSAEAANCIDTLRLDSLIQVGSIPEVDFEFTSDQACEEVLAVFQNNSTNAYGDIIEYEWSFGDGSTSNEEQGEHLFISAENNTVSLTATTEFGCTNSSEQIIQILPNAVPTLPEDYTMCIGDSVQIMGTTVGSGIDDIVFSWNMPDDLSCDDCLQPIADPIDSTLYILTAEHSNGCVTMDTMLINVVPVMGPQLALSMDTIICDMDTATISIANFDSSLDYTWNPSPTLSCFDCEYATAYPEDDTYYTVTVRNEYGCFKTDSLLVEVEREIEDFLIEDRGICEDNSTIITVDNLVLNPKWDSDNSLSCTDCYEVTATPEQSQFYYVDVVSQAGCEYRDSVYVTVVPEDALSINGDGRICKGEQYLLASSGVGVPQWSPDINVINTQEPLTYAYPNESTIYTVTYTYDECIQQDEVNVEVIYKADITAIGDTICEDETAVLSAGGLANFFTWLDMDGNILTSGDTILYDTDYSDDLMVIGKLGLCEEDTSIVNIIVHPFIDVSINTYDYELYINSAEVVDIDFNEFSDYNYSWSPADGLSCDDCPDPKIKNLDQAMQYTLTVTDEITGCDIEETISARFINLCSEKAFYIPNIFTPNSDGVNDYFQVIAERPEEFNSLTLFDRWGNQMYTSTDVLGRWDGRYKGQPLSPGVYPYRIDYTCTETGERLALYGDVTVIR